MFKHLLPLFLCLSVASCASLNPLSILNPDKPSLEVSAQVGKTNEQEKNNIKIESDKKEIKQEANKITNDSNYTAEKIENITQGMSKFELILFALLAGWAIPTPSFSAMYKGIKLVISDIYTAAIVAPLKGIASFVLMLFGRK